MVTAALVQLSYSFDAGLTNLIIYMIVSYAGEDIPTDPDPSNEAFHPETQGVCLEAIRIPRDSPPSRVTKVVADAVIAYAQDTWGATVAPPQVLMTGLMMGT